MISEKKIVFLHFSLKRLWRFCLCLNAESINSLGVSFVWRDSRCNFFAESVFFNVVNRVSRFDILALQCPFLHCLLFRYCITRCFVNALNFVLLRSIRYIVSYYLLFCCVLTLILLLHYLCFATDYTIQLLLCLLFCFCNTSYSIFIT